jgi:uncharacterized membrane protein
VPLDALRGLIMVLMSLDHASYFVARAHSSGEFWDRPLPHYDDALPFLTRFVTHFSAPGFFFLMGVGMALFTVARRRLGWTAGAITRHLLVRGALLIALQLLVENRAWPLGLPPGIPDIFVLYFGVLYGLGATMIVVALLARLGLWVLAGASVLAIVAAEALLPGAAQPVAPLLRLLLVAGEEGSLRVYYPLIPWFGVTGLGLVFGHWLARQEMRAYRGALAAGGAALLLFVLLRVGGGYGNMHPVPGATWLDFLNVTKYPPSLTFLLLTLGGDLLLLGLLAALARSWPGGRWAHPLLVFGRVPLFFYLAQLFLFGLIGLAFAPDGTGIPRMYPIWLLGLAVLFPLCWGYGRFKRRQPPDSLWRFF